MKKNKESLVIFLAVFTVMALSFLLMSYNNIEKHQKRYKLSAEADKEIKSKLPPMTEERKQAIKQQNAFLEANKIGSIQGSYGSTDIDGIEKRENLFYEMFRDAHWSKNNNLSLTIDSLYWDTTIEGMLDKKSATLHGVGGAKSGIIITESGGKSYTYDEWIALHPDWYLAGIAKFEAEFPGVVVQNGKHGVGLTQTAAPTQTNLIPTVTKDGKYMWNGIDFSCVFNYKTYADRYPDLKAAFGYNKELLFKHFIEHGIAEGRTAI